MAAPKDEPKIHVAIGFDFETGDVECRTGACTQLSLQAIRLDTMQVFDKYQSYIYPYNKQEFEGAKAKKKKTLKTKHEIEQEEAGELMDYKEKALTYSAVTMDMLYKMGIDIKQVGLDVIDFVKKNTLTNSKATKPLLIGQNSQFDVGFMQQLMCYSGLLKEFSQVFAGQEDFWGNFQPHYVDTIDLGKLALAHNPDMNSYNLEIMCDRLGIDLEDAHDADADVTATLNVATVCASKMRSSGDGGDIMLSKAEKSRKHFKITCVK